ncbi:MAG: NAD(P)/FAD-dependent oxidoreductase [Haliea sp.]
MLRQQGIPHAGVIPVASSRTPEALDTAGASDCAIVDLDLTSADAAPGPGRTATKLLSALSATGCDPRQAFASRDSRHLTCVVASPDMSQLLAVLAEQGVTAPASWTCQELAPDDGGLLQSFTPAPDTAGAPQAPDTGINAGMPASETGAAGSTARQPVPEHFDAVIIGAGMSGLSMLERLLRSGLRTLVLESASDVGGVWFWNRYPGARVDSESYTYGLSVSGELVRDWRWQELFAAQPEVLAYLQHVADHFQLRPHIRFGVPVASAHFDAAASRWHIEAESGELLTATYLVAATGTLTVPQWPDYPGLGDFRGQSCHTARWPESGFDLRGKRVGVIGTGASGVQVIQTIAAEVQQLTVFQRTPTYCIPQRNQTLSAADYRGILEDWEGILASCRNSYGGFIHCFDPRSGLAVSEQERERKFEELWQRPGFAFWFANFGDLMMNHEVNNHACEFLRQKIRERVHNPDVARKLLPDHPFGSKRVPLENGYYEVFNRPNTRLVDLRETPVECITDRGVLCSGEEHPLDAIVYATGFDAGTGALTRIRIEGSRGTSLADHWHQGPRTFLGLLVSGFPNLFIVNGPQNAARLCNAGRCIEQNVDWIARCLGFLADHHYTQVEPSMIAEANWVAHVDDVAEASVLASMRDSWFFGANTPGKAQQVNIYAAGAREYRQHCEAVASAGYPGLLMS